MLALNTIPVEGIRTCGSCKKDYYKKYGMSNGRCTACISRTKYYSNLSYYKEYHKVWAANERKENPKRVKLRENRRSKNRDLLKERYGITQFQYNEILKKQNDGCAICGGKNSFKNSVRDLFVDHDHKTGKVRGLLCNHCNTGLGHFKDNPEQLHKAISYLLIHKEIL